VLVEWPEFPAANEYAQARPRRAAELFGERDRFGIGIELGIEQDGCAVVEQEADVVDTLGVAGGVYHRAPDESRDEGGGRMILMARRGHWLRLAAPRCAPRLVILRRCRSRGWEQSCSQPPRATPWRPVT
jgi:hypothetical protein